MDGHTRIVSSTNFDNFNFITMQLLLYLFSYKSIPVVLVMVIILSGIAAVLSPLAVAERGNALGAH